jgi:hypothetical protein
MEKSRPKRRGLYRPKSDLSTGRFAVGGRGPMRPASLKRAATRLAAICEAGGIPL